MDKLKSLIKKGNCPKIYAVVEYAVAVYVGLTSVINLLNIAGIITFEKGFMQSTFWGASLLILLLLQYGLIVSNRNEVRLTQMRPYVVGLMLAGVISVCNTPLVLLMLLLIGYFLMTGYDKKFDLKISVLAALVACVGIEVYSVAMLLSDGVGVVGQGFLNSIWPDFLFVAVAIIYCVVNKEDELVEVEESELVEAEESAETIDAVDSEQEKAESVASEEIVEKKNSKIRELAEKVSTKIKPGFHWIQENSERVARYLGGVLCMLSLGLFLFYYVSVVAGVNKIANTSEEVYLLQHCEDTSLVLSLVEDAENGTYTVAFQEYTGANNQKVQLCDREDGIYQLVFADADYALEATLDETTGQIVLGVSPMADVSNQCWLKQEFIPERDMYKFLCTYGVPLSYQMISQASGIPEVMVQGYTGGYEFFTLERTVADEFVTEVVLKHGDDFPPTLLMETIIGYLGGWSFVIFLSVVVVFCIIINARRLVGDKPAVLYAIVFAYMLAYASVGAIALFLLAFGMLCINSYLRRQAKQKPVAIKQYNESLSEVVKAEMQESLESMEKSLQEMKRMLNQ